MSLHLEFNLTVRLESLIVYGLKSYPEGISGSIGLIFEAVDEQRFKIPIPFRRINIQIIFCMERKEFNLK